MISELNYNEAFSLLVNGDFIVTEKEPGLKTHSLPFFQSPSKWRFHCNGRNNQEIIKYISAFSLLVNGDFIVTISETNQKARQSHLSVS